MKCLELLAVSVMLSALGAQGAYAEHTLPPMTGVEISNEISIEAPDIGSEERLCPDIPVCPETTKCLEPETVCPIEGQSRADFSRMVSDSRRYIEFLRNEVYFYLDDSAGSKVLEYLVVELDRYYFTYRDVPGSEEALYLKSRVLNEWKKYEDELVCLLKIIYEYPAGPFYNKARTDAMELLAGKLKRDLKDNPDLLAGQRGPVRSDNQASMLEGLVRLGSSKYRDLQMRELDEFLSYYPRHPKSDLMMTFKANNYVNRGNHEAAAHTLRRFAAFYPKSPMRPASLYMLGLIYSDELGEYEKAVKVFREIIDVHPDSSQAVSSHERAAEIYYRKLKSPDKAIRMLEDIAYKYPATDAALRAFTFMASIHEAEKDYKAAIGAFRRQSEMFSARPDDAVKALFEAGRVADKRLGDDRLYVEMMLDVHKRYPKHPLAAEALYNAAYRFENEFREMDPAKKYYRMVAGEFPSDKYAGRAQKRLDSILAREMKEELRRQEELEKQREKEGGALTAPAPGR